MDQNKSGHSSREKTSKWTTIDTVFLLLAVVVVVGAAVRTVDFLLPDRQTSQPFYVYFTAETYQTVPGSIGEQDDLCLYNTDTRIGYIRAQDVQSGPVDAEHNVILSGFFVVDNGSMADDGSLVVKKSDVRLASGEDIAVCTDRVVLQIHIKSVETSIIEPESDTTLDEVGSEEEVTTEATSDTAPDVSLEEDRDQTEDDSDPAEVDSDSAEVDSEAGADESVEPEGTQAEEASSEPAQME